MKNLLYCRRTFTAFFSIISLVGLSAYNGFDPSMAVASIAVGLAGANAWEKGWKAQAPERYTTED